jgi:hypothetical protein
MDAVSHFYKTVNSVVEEKKTWTQSVDWETKPIYPNFSFPVDYGKDEIRRFLTNQHIMFRSENQGKPQLFLRGNKYIDVERLTLVCSSRYRKRANRTKAVRQTSSIRSLSSGPETDCSWCLRLKREDDGPWIVVSMITEHTNHYSYDCISSNSVYSDFDNVVMSIKELGDGDVAMFVKLYEAHTPTPCIRQFFMDKGIELSKQQLQNLARKLNLKSVKLKHPKSIVPTRMVGAPETLQLLGELQNEERIFLVRFQVMKLGQVTQELTILKVPSQDPVISDKWQQEHSSVFEFICKQKGYSKSQPLPSSNISFSSPLPSPSLSSSPSPSPSSSPSPSQSLSSSSDLLLPCNIHTIIPMTPSSSTCHTAPTPMCSPQTAIEALGDAWMGVFSCCKGADAIKFDGCVWSDESIILTAALYPEVIQLDTTAKTNLYNYPLIFLVGVDAENKSQNWFTGLLPDQKRTTFIWFLKVFSIFFGPILQGVQTVITDGDRQLVDSVAFAIHSKIFHLQTTQLLCYWHTVSLYFNNNLPLLASQYVETLKFYCKEIAVCDNKEEVDSLWKYVTETYVPSLEISDAKKAVVQEVLVTVRSKERLWCRAWFAATRNFGEITSGRSETENHHHKLDSFVHSKTSLHKTCEADFNRMNRRAIVMKQSLIHDLRHQILHDQSDESLPPWVFEQLTSNGAKIFQTQWKYSTFYHITPLSSTSFSLVYRDSTFEKSQDSADNVAHQTHRVDVSSQGFLTCQCSFYVSYVMICRHMMAIMRHYHLTIKPLDVHLRWWKAWKRGFFLGRYHRHFNDGLPGIYLSEPLPLLSSSLLPSSPSSLPSSPSSLPSSPSLFPSSPSSLSFPSTQESSYHVLKKCFGDLEKNILDLVSHSDEASQFTIQELQNFEKTLRQNLHQQFPSSSQFCAGIPTDQPQSHKRSLFRFEQASKKRPRRLSPIRIRRQRNGTPPLL